MITVRSRWSGGSAWYAARWAMPSPTPESTIVTDSTSRLPAAAVDSA